LINFVAAGTVAAISFPAPHRMNSAINFVELDNRVISATYRNLMIKAKVVLVDKASGQPLPEPVTTISSPLPAGSLRIRLPESVKAGIYFLEAFNVHGQKVAQSAAFEIS
jgi:hypothetical protein